LLYLLALETRKYALYPLINCISRVFKQTLITKEKMTATAENRGIIRAEHRLAAFSRRFPPSGHSERGSQVCKPLSERSETTSQVCKPLSESIETTLQGCKPLSERLETTLQGCKPLSERLETTLQVCKPLSESIETASQVCKPLSERSDTILTYLLIHKI
jgi:hypothetical protein